MIAGVEVLSATVLVITAVRPNDKTGIGETGETTTKSVEKVELVGLTTSLALVFVIFTTLVVVTASAHGALARDDDFFNDFMKVDDFMEL